MKLYVVIIYNSFYTSTIKKLSFIKDLCFCNFYLFSISLWELNSYLGWSLLYLLPLKRNISKRDVYFDCYHLWCGWKFPNLYASTLSVQNQIIIGLIVSTVISLVTSAPKQPSSREKIMGKNIQFTKWNTREIFFLQYAVICNLKFCKLSLENIFRYLHFCKLL